MGVGGGPWPVVIVTHGLTGQRIGRSYHKVEFGRRLAERGIACVRFDQAGCGESTGKFQDLTIRSMTEDLLAVRQWVDDQPWADAGRVGYVGVSLGGLATAAAEARQPGRAVALWAGVYDLPRVFSRVTTPALSGLMAEQGWVPYRGLRIGAGFMRSLGAIDTAECLAESDAPLLVCHSEQDDVVPLAEGLAYEKRCGELGRPCRLEAFTGANHDFAEFEDRQKLLGLTLEFMAEHLGRAASTP